MKEKNSNRLALVNFLMLCSINHVPDLAESTKVVQLDVTNLARVLVLHVLMIARPLGVLRRRDVMQNVPNTRVASWTDFQAGKFNSIEHEDLLMTISAYTVICLNSA